MSMILILNLAKRYCIKTIGDSNNSVFDEAFENFPFFSNCKLLFDKYLEF